MRSQDKILKSPINFETQSTLRTAVLAHLNTVHVILLGDSTSLVIVSRDLSPQQTLDKPLQWQLEPP